MLSERCAAPSDVVPPPSRTSEEATSGTGRPGGAKLGGAAAPELGAAGGGAAPSQPAESCRVSPAPGGAANTPGDGTPLDARGCGGKAPQAPVANFGGGRPSSSVRPGAKPGGAGRAATNILGEHTHKAAGSATLGQTA
mmetsp:Transcript_102649/g.275668  ORF Transcript_102649/g.275668 Transcript_102649/m.275668 type:complete len:139 (+) Transcript_102649:1916-2332(+)